MPVGLCIPVGRHPRRLAFPPAGDRVAWRPRNRTIAGPRAFGIIIGSRRAQQLPAHLLPERNARMPPESRQIDSTIDVVTPENISFQYQLAGPFRRLPAFLIDVSLRFAIWIGVFILLAIAGGLGGGAFSSLGFSLWLLLWFVMEWFYGGLLETFWNGQTVGKRLLGMRVLRIDGQPINGLQAVMRNVLRLVDMMPLIPLGAWVGEEGPWAIPSCLIGLLTPIVTRRSQRLGDLVCGTMVVVEERQWLLSVAKMDHPEVRRLASELPASFTVSHALSRALAAYVERRRYLSAARRAEIAHHLGEPLTARFGLPPNLDHDLLLCALYYRTFVAAQSPGPSDSRGKPGTTLPAERPATTADPVSAEA